MNTTRLALISPYSHVEKVMNIFKNLGATIREFGEYSGKRFFYMHGQFVCYTDDLSFSSNTPDKSFRVWKIEDFLLQYPFQIGDAVKVMDVSDDSIYQITQYEWVNDQIIYHLYNETEGVRSSDVFSLMLVRKAQNIPCLKINPDIHTSDSCITFQCGNSNIQCDKIKLDMDEDQEIKQIDGQFFIVRKKKVYPDSCHEAEKILSYDTREDAVKIIENHGYDLHALARLLIIRQAYLKVANIPFKEDGTQEQFIITRFNGEITKMSTQHRNSLLSFPTEELRDMFYNNFIRDIKACKNLI